MEQRKKWVAPPLDDDKFEWMRKLLAAPSPVGFEAAMYATCTRPCLYKSIASRTIYPNLSALSFSSSLAKLTGSRIQRLKSNRTEGVLRPYFEEFMPKGWEFRTFKGTRDDGFFKYIYSSHSWFFLHLLPFYQSSPTLPLLQTVSQD